MWLERLSSEVAVYLSMETNQTCLQRLRLFVIFAHMLGVVQSLSIVTSKQAMNSLYTVGDVVSVGVDELIFGIRMDGGCCNGRSEDGIVGAFIICRVE